MCNKKKDIFGVVHQPQFDSELMYIGKVVSVKYVGGDRKSKNELPYNRSITGMISYTSPFSLEITTVVPSCNEDNKSYLSAQSATGISGKIVNNSILIEDVLKGVITIEEYKL